VINHRKILLSGGLILASGGYAWWQSQDRHALTRPAPSPIAAQMPAKALTPKKPLPPSRPPATVAMNQPAQTAPTPEPLTEPVARPKTRRAKPGTVADTPAPSPPPEPLNAVQLTDQPATSTGRYMDGEFVGNAFDGEWGPVQVKAVIRNGDLADVIVLEYPIHRQRSAEISEWAIPQLYEEAIKAQSAEIDMVSQASFTSENFQESLASALARAHKP
jgi:uncharacterized protein with FMN-binding domain